MSDKPIRICVATSYGATQEPRGPRYAAELARMDPRFQVTFIDCVARGGERAPSAEFRGVGNLQWKSWMFPWRGGGRVRLTAEKIRQRIAERAFLRSKELRTGLLSTRSIGLQEMLLAERADLYFGFNIDTLLPVYTAARRAGAPFLFDCHEIHAEMSEDQPEAERAIIRAVQRRCLPGCALVTAASPQAAARIEHDFGISGVVPLLNAAPLEAVTPRECEEELALYWRNYTIDLGPRGPDDILRAMPLLPPDVRLYLQGFPSRYNAGRVEQLIRELGIQDRVTILPPYRIEDAVQAAVPYCVGLSLQSPAIVNMDLSSTNKFFEYAMAGLAIVSSKTAGHRDLVTSAQLGLLYESGDAQDLARQILRLYEDRALLGAMRANARRYAEGEGNLQFQMRRFREAFRERVLPLMERG